MSFLVPVMMFGWIPVVIGLFSKLPPRRAVIVSFLFAWLFLPMAKYPIAGLPNYTKMSATCWGIFIAAFLFDSQRLLTFRPRLLDIPMVVWCFCPLASSLHNDLGLYDGLSASLRQIVIWGFPYLVGRLYFSDFEGLREFAIGIFIGGLIYMPFCWYEIRMSPQLHHLFYGFTQHSFIQTHRYGGWRPMVFMEHGLMLGIWMTSASFIGVWLWMSGTLKKIGRFSMPWLVIPLVLTSIFCRSTGAIALFFMGIGLSFMTRLFQKKIWIIGLLLIPVCYLPVRATGYWDGDNLAHFLYDNFNKQRALSLYARFYNENILTEKALERPVFGWGGWGRARVYDEYGNDISVTDSLWIIVFGNHGLFGLASVTLSILLPVVVFLRLSDIREWFKPRMASAAVLAILLGLYMIDNLLNAMINPIFMVAAGGITGLMKDPMCQVKHDAVPMDKAWRGSLYRPRFI